MAITDKEEARIREIVREEILLLVRANSIGIDYTTVIADGLDEEAIKRMAEEVTKNVVTDRRQGD